VWKAAPKCYHNPSFLMVMKSSVIKSKPDETKSPTVKLSRYEGWRTEHWRDENHPMRFRVASLNVGTMWGRSEQVLETLSQRQMNVWCVQEIRSKGRSARMITRKNKTQVLLEGR